MVIIGDGLYLIVFGECVDGFGGVFVELKCYVGERFLWNEFFVVDDIFVYFDDVGGVGVEWFGIGLGYFCDYCCLVWLGLWVGEYFEELFGCDG